MNRFRNLGLALSLLGVLLIAVGASPLFAQEADDHPVTGGAMSHEQMHQMMDAMHGEGTSQRMHEARGEDGERMMEQCAVMMNMMAGMSGMMGAPEDGPAPAMPAGQMSPSMQDMMQQMMGR